MQTTSLKSNTWHATLIGMVLTALLMTGTAVSAGTAEKEYILGVFPYLPPRELEKIFSPMAADISKVIGKPVIFRTSSTYKKFMHQLDKQVFDIAFIQPFDYIRAADKHGYTPLATRQESLSAILVTKQNSPLRSIKDLKNRTVSLPPKVSAVSRLTKDHLTSKNFILGKNIKLSHHRSHVSCMQQVLIGSADACGTAIPAVRFFEHKMKVKLKVIGKTMAIPHSLFSIHPRIPVTVKNKIQRRIVNWAKTAEGQKMLARGQLKPLKPIKDDDYNIVRKIAK